MKKILLLNPPGRRPYLRDQYCSSAAKARYYWPAVDLLVLSGIIGGHFPVAVIDAIAENITPSVLEKKIEQGNYAAAVCLSSSASMPEDFALFGRLKERFGTAVIVNAGFLRHNTRGYLEKHPYIDAVILDYTRGGVVEFLRGNAGNLPGLSYLRGGEFYGGAKDKGTDKYFRFPPPRHELFPLTRYWTPQARQYPFSCAISTAGCAYQCRFCASATIPFRLRRVANLIEELKYARKLGIREIHFPDFTFTADRRHCLAVCRAIAGAGLGITWDCLTRADCFDDELAGMMKRAGCHTVQFGVETKNERVLKAMGKPIANSVMRRAFAACRKAGMETLGFFIIGFPGEDEASIRETISFARELDCDYASFSVFVPDFGTEARRRVIENNPRLEHELVFDRTGYPRAGNEFLSARKIWRLYNNAVRRFYFRPGFVFRRLRRIKSFARARAAWRIFRSLARAQFFGESRA